MKVVINQCHGGFSISAEALQEYIKLSGNKQATGYDISRNDINLVAIVEKLQEKANGPFAKLTIVEVPDDVKWFIQEYDGMEWVAEEHRTWS